MVFLDCGNIDRMPVDFLKHEGTHILNIDHHHDNTRFGTVNLVVSDASCTAEIVYDLARELGARITPEIADAMYVGLVTDTGRFMYQNTTPAAHRMAADLIEAGVDTHDVYRRLYEDLPLRRLELLQRALASVERFDDGAITMGSLTRADFEADGRVRDRLRGHRGPHALGRGHQGRGAGARAAGRRPPRPEQGQPARHRRQRGRVGDRPRAGRRRPPPGGGRLDVALARGAGGGDPQARGANSWGADAGPGGG